MSDTIKLHSDIEDAARLGAKEMKEFLETYHGDDPVAVVRVAYGSKAVIIEAEARGEVNRLTGWMFAASLNFAALSFLMYFRNVLPCWSVALLGAMVVAAFLLGRAWPE